MDLLFTQLWISGLRNLLVSLNWSEALVLTIFWDVGNSKIFETFVRIVNLLLTYASNGLQTDAARCSTPRSREDSSCQPSKRETVSAFGNHFCRMTKNGLDSSHDAPLQCGKQHVAIKIFENGSFGRSTYRNISTMLFKNTVNSGIVNFILTVNLFGWNTISQRTN